MKVTITPRLLSGALTVPPSKSQTHRLLIAAALASGESHFEKIALSQDILATIGCLRALGAEISDDCSVVRGIACGQGARPQLFCGESGSTLRFLIPVALSVAGGGTFTGRGRLMERPQEPYWNLFAKQGISCTAENGTINVHGTLHSGTFSLPGNVSSQFFTGLLFALPLLQGDSVVEATTALESRSYLNMTLDVLAQFGVRVQQSDDSFTVPGGQQYRPANCTVEGDWSQAGFFYAANGLGSSIALLGMRLDSAQGDRCIVDYASRLRGRGTVILDVSDCPDLVPPLAVFAALRAGEETQIVHAARLQLKESDRLQTVTQTLHRLGAQITKLPDGLVIHGVEQLHGGVTVDACNDHRIAMMAAVAATRCTRPVTILGAECVQKSYPNFWEDYARLGGILRREETA